jgi:hypothetical protein
MPISYFLVCGGSLVYTLGQGTVTNEDILAHTCLLSEDERVRIGGRELVDFRGVSSVRVSREGFTSIIGHDKLYGERFEGWRCAIVVNSALLFGWAKTFTTLRRMLNAPGEMVVFRSIDKACDWLGIEEQDIVPSGPQAA